MRILVVDDELLTQKLLAKILAPFATVDLAGDGEEALSRFYAASSDGAPYDLVFLDIKMPKLTGQDVLVSIRDHEQNSGMQPTSGVKVIMTTGLDDEEHQFEAAVSGCDAYLVKPVSRDAVLGELKGLGLIEA